LYYFEEVSLSCKFLGCAGGPLKRIMTQRDIVERYKKGDICRKEGKQKKRSYEQWKGGSRKETLASRSSILDTSG
jgi:hypothetical protein